MVQLRANVLEKNIVFPTSGVKIEVPNTRIFIADQEYGTGTLCVAESNLIWRNVNEEGLCIEYPNIALHAVSRDLSAFEHECIYMVLDKNLIEMEGEEDEGEEKEEEMTIIRLVPEDKLKLNQIFSAMNDCQALYPDEMNDSDEEEGKGNDFDNIGYENYESGEGMTEFTDYFTSETDPENIQLSERGQEVLRRINFNFKPSNSEDKNNNKDNQQYEDAE